MHESLLALWTSRTGCDLQEQIVLNFLSVYAINKDALEGFLKAVEFFWATRTQYAYENLVRKPIALMI